MLMYGGYSSGKINGYNIPQAYIVLCGFFILSTLVILVRRQVVPSPSTAASVAHMPLNRK